MAQHPPPTTALGFVPIRQRDFTFAFAARIFSDMANRMGRVAIGWEVWPITRSELMPGYAGPA